MGILLYTIHVVTSLFLILVVLLQQGKGADLSVFGGGGTMTAFGARGAASLLHRLTVGGFVIFIFTTLAIGVYQSGSGGSVMGDVPAGDETPAAEAESAPDVATPETPPPGDETAPPSEGALPEGGGAGVLPEAPGQTLGADPEAEDAEDGTTDEPAATDSGAGDG